MLPEGCHEILMSSCSTCTATCSILKYSHFWSGSPRSKLISSVSLVLVIRWDAETMFSCSYSALFRVFFCSLFSPKQHYSSHIVHFQPTSLFTSAARPNNLFIVKSANDCEVSGGGSGEGDGGGGNEGKMWGTGKGRGDGWMNGLVQQCVAEQH